jgi:hypothetical protein
MLCCVPNSCVNHEVKIFNKILDKLKRAFPNLSVITVGTDRDLYTRHERHLNGHGKEHVANKIAAVVNDLFSPKVSSLIALGSKEKSDIPSCPIENRSLCVKEVDLSGCKKLSQLQFYQNGDSVDYIECDGTTESSEENQVWTTQETKKNICSVRKNEESL